MTLQKTETKASLVINITANLLSYTIIYPSCDVDILTHDQVKNKIPIIIGLNKKEKIEIRNYIVSTVAEYKKYLKL